jgi:hypothetical protein
MQKITVLGTVVSTLTVAGLMTGHMPKHMRENNLFDAARMALDTAATITYPLRGDFTEVHREVVQGIRKTNGSCKFQVILRGEKVRLGGQIVAQNLRTCEFTVVYGYRNSPAR